MRHRGRKRESELGVAILQNHVGIGAGSIEPTTNCLQNVFVPTWSIVDQTLAALANLKTSVIKAQLRHSQSSDGTSQAHDGLNLRLTW
jgi:hypothetical protein